MSTYDSYMVNNNKIVCLQCMLCEAMFYNKKAYTTHNFHHTPDDLYIDTEQVVEPSSPWAVFGPKFQSALRAGLTIFIS